jgi:hypothetical protein
MVSAPSLTGPNGSIKPKVTWNLLKNNVPNLLAHVIFPLLCLTQEDLELWNDDPVEYIHKKIGNLQIRSERLI